jgi:hypothetical protein
MIECVLNYTFLCARNWVKLDQEVLYEHVPKSVETGHEGKVTMLQNGQAKTGRFTPNNKLDIIIHDNKKGTCLLIDIAILGATNVIKKESEKTLKYMTKQ